MTNFDLYCERVGSGLLAEPVNAATNIAFLVAGFVLWRQYRQSEALSIDIQLLIYLIIMIGIGSALFHTFATIWARVLDVVPILLFQLMFVWVYTRQVMGWSIVQAGTILTMVLAGALIGRLFPHLLNGSLPYIPALIVLLVLGIHHWSRHKPIPLILLAATAVFSGALLFRVVDTAVCMQFPIGTHFLWHIANAVVLYLCVSALIKVRR